MESHKKVTACVLGLAGAFALSGAAHAGDHPDGYGSPDFGVIRDQLLEALSLPLFGVEKPLRRASRQSIDAATADSNPRALVRLARGLRARVVSAEADLGPNIDMMALYPPHHPTHIIACNEQGPTEPGLQRIRLSDGKAETILTGTNSCDPVHVTPWGTVLFGEESGSTGTVLKLIHPLGTTGVMYDREAHTLTGADAANVVERPALGHLSFEGVVVYPNGVVYYGDENRPADGVGGGAYFKFIPDVPWMGGGWISDLSQSPLVAGSVYGLRLGMRSGGTDYGQGTETGRGTWVQVVTSYDADLRAAAAELSLTGYYRPEDGNADERALAKGYVRFCSNNTGNEGDDQSWGNTICVTDGTLDEALANTAVPAVQLFVVGTPAFSMMDNIAYRPYAGTWVLHEDRDAVELTDGRYPFNDSIWMCLEDGKDDDTLSDGCVRVVTLNDLNAESTGGFFDRSGRHYFFSVQHNVTGHGVILDVTGWH